MNNVCRSSLALAILAAAAAGAGWENVTSNVGGEKWGYAGVTLLAPVPGRDEVIAGVSEAGLWSTTDGGKTWQKLGAQDPEPIRNRPCQIVFDPKDPNTFWLSGNYGSGVFRTTDGGKSFVRLGKLGHVDGIAIDFTDPQRNTLVVGLHEQTRSLQKSTDGGKTWAPIATSLPEKTNFTSHAVVQDRNTFVVGVSGWKQGYAWGIFRTEDGGTTWAQVSTFGPGGPPLVASDGAILWQICWGGGLVRSADGGKTWQKLASPVKSPLIETPGGRLVGFAGDQLHASADGGKAWSELGPRLPRKASGVVYDAQRRSFFAWAASEKKTTDAVFRWDEAP